MVDRITLPNPDDVCKIVQVYVRGTPYLRCGPPGDAPSNFNHSQILENLVKEFELPIPKKRNARGIEIPLIEGE